MFTCNKANNRLIGRLILIFFGLSALLIIISIMEISVCFSAEEVSYSDYVNEMIDDMDLSEMEEELQGIDYLGEIQGETLKDKIKYLVYGGVDGESIVNGFLSLFISGFKNVLPTISVLFALGVISGMTEVIKPNGKSLKMGGAVYFICYLSAISVLIILFINKTQQVKAAISDVSKQTDVIMPVILSLMSLSGSNATVLMYRPITVVLTQVLYRLSTLVMMPLVVGVTISNALSELSDGSDFSALKNFLTSAYKWIFGLAVTVFGVYVSVKGITNNAFDSLTIRSVKYFGNSLPVVGGFISGSTELFAGCCLVVKNSLGKLFLVVLIFQLSSPFLGILIMIFALNLTAAGVQPFADKKLVSLYTGMAKSLQYLLSIMVMVFFTYFITLIMLLFATGVA